MAESIVGRKMRLYVREDPDGLPDVALGLIERWADAIDATCGQALDALEFAQGALIDAVGLEDGLDGQAGGAVIYMIRAALKANGRELTPLPGPDDEATYESFAEKLLAGHPKTPAEEGE